MLARWEEARLLRDCWQPEPELGPPAKPCKLRPVSPKPEGAGEEEQRRGCPAFRGCWEQAGKLPGNLFLYFFNHFLPNTVQYAVLQLTCNNDHNTLKAVLEYGEEIGGLGPIWEPIKSADRTKKYDIENVPKKEKETIKNESKQLRYHSSRVAIA